MARAGILTFQNSNSYGAVMQAYALQEAVRKTGADVKIINYDSPGMGLAAIQKPCFKQFCREHLPLTQNVNRGDEIDTSQFDMIIAGSDQIWNPFLTAQDETYFLDFIKDNTAKAAYAASIGANPQYFDQIRPVFEKHIPGFAAISLRESSFVPLVQEYASCEIQCALDPSFLLTKEEYSENFDLHDEEGGYIFLFNLQKDPKLTDLANMISLQYGRRLIAVTKYEDYFFLKGAEIYREIPPAKWLEYIKNADLVLTDSFHGTAFSIIFERPFYVYTQATYNVVRVLEILNRLGLTGRAISRLGDIRDIAFDMDYAQARERLNAEKAKSLAYLKGILGQLMPDFQP